jgi:hypothetical protein
VDQEPNAVRAGGSFEPSRGPRILVAVVAVMLLFAVVKPWAFSGGGSGGAAAPGSARELAASPTPPPTPTPIPADPYGMDCLSGDTEQAVALERWPDNQVRTWVAIEDAVATGPLDTAMPRIVIHSSHVVGIGVCAARSLAGATRSGAWVRDVQSILKVDVAFDLGAPDPINRDVGTPDGAVLYGWITPPGPAASPMPPPTPWPAGSYALSFTFPIDATRQLHWLRVDLVADAP